MRPSPLDIRKQEFHTRFRGYDPDEVNATLTVLAQQWDEMETELRRRDDRLTQLEVKLQHYERVEEALQQAIETARESSRQAMATAEAKAEQLRIEAHEEARGIKRDAETERLRLRQETQAIAARRKEIVARLRAFLMSEMEMLAHFEGEDPVGFIRLMPPGSGQLPAAPADGLGPYESLMDEAMADEALTDMEAMAGTPHSHDEPVVYADDADEGIGLDDETTDTAPTMDIRMEAEETLASDESEGFDGLPFEPEVVLPDALPTDETSAAATFSEETSLVEAEGAAESLPASDESADTFGASPTPADAPNAGPETPQMVALSDIFSDAQSAAALPRPPADANPPEPTDYDQLTEEWTVELPAPEPMLWDTERPVSEADLPPAYDDVYVPQPGTTWEPEPLESSPRPPDAPTEAPFPPTGYTVSSEFAFDPGPVDLSATNQAVWSDDLLDRLMPPVGDRVSPVEDPASTPSAPPPTAASPPEVSPDPLPVPRTVARSGYAVESLLGDLSEASAPPDAQPPPVASGSGEEIERIRRLLSGLG